MNIGLQKYPFVSTKLEGKGQVSIGTTATRIQFSMRPTTVTISAESTNTGTLYYGGSSITSTGANAVGCLHAGDSVTLNFDTTDGSLYIVSSVASQSYWAGAFC